MADRARSTSARSLAGARPARVVHAPPEPALATLVDSPPKGSDFAHELKWDGFRILATIQDGAVRLWSRHAVDWTGKLEAIARALLKLRCRSAVLDGELIAGGGLQTDFNLLQDAVARRSTAGLTLVGFDLLNLDDLDLRGCAWHARRTVLAQLLDVPVPRLAFSTAIIGRSEEALALARAGRFEGIVSKRIDAPYPAGRSRDWLKTRNQGSEDLALVGFVPSAARADDADWLLLGRPGPSSTWIYAGRVRPGSPTLRAELAPFLAGGVESPPSVAIDASQREGLRGARWFPPRLVLEVNQRGVGKQSQFRQPILKAVRRDLLPEDLR